MKKLSLATLGELDPKVAVPAYDPAATEVGILHLGIGRFHRGHQAVYVDRLMELDSGERDWAICGVSLQSSRTRDQLRSQDCLYVLGETGTQATRYRVIGSVREALFAPEESETLLERFADAAVRIVTLTITEKGYCRNPSTGGLLTDHPDVRHDLEMGEAKLPRTALGWLALGLDRRRREGAGPITLLSCDNLAGNGRQLRRVFLEFVDAKPELKAWVEANVSFPCSMVDRIVPEIDEAAAQAVRQAVGVNDASPVLTESFTQWVIEDDFKAGRPRWESVGVQFCSDITPYEKRKLRLLNASHSTLAYLGSLAGFETVDQAIAFEPLRTFVDKLMIAAEPDAPAEYRAALIQRFANPALKHKLSQIAMDGSQKIPPRLVAPALERLARGETVREHALAIAGWIRFVAQAQANGEKLADPMAERLLSTARAAGDDPATLARAFLSIREVFGEGAGALEAPVVAWLDRLSKSAPHGVMGLDEAARESSRP